MFRYTFLCFTDISENYKFVATKYDSMEAGLFKEINYEPCELGKNLDMKYKNVVETFERVEDYNLNDYFCLNFNNTEFTLIDDQYEQLLELKLESKCEDFLLVFTIVTQNDLLEHNNKYNPISPFYQKQIITSYKNLKTKLLFNYNYIKYETDNGFIFSKKKILMVYGCQINQIFLKVMMKFLIFNLK